MSENITVDFVEDIIEVDLIEQSIEVDFVEDIITVNFIEEVIEVDFVEDVIEVDFQGAIVSITINDPITYSKIINDGETKEIVAFLGSTYRTVEFIISVNDDNTGNFFSSKILAQHDDTNAEYNHFALLGTRNVNFFVVYEDNKIKLKGTGTKDNQIVKVISFKVEK